jgi:hypothetical protein
MLTDIELDEYRAAIRREVCSLCPERPPGGPPCAPLGKDCGVELHLPELIESIRQTHSPLIAPYLARNQEQICARCAFLKASICPCPMEYLVVPLVEAVEAVDERRRGLPPEPDRQAEAPTEPVDGLVQTTRVTLTVREGSLKGRTWELAGPERCFIGRAQDCAICLAGSLEFCTVSRFHCIVEVDRDGVRVRDLGSYNGTRINGVQIGRPRNRHRAAAPGAAPVGTVELHDGDDFRVGDTSFTVAVTRDWIPAKGDASQAEEGPAGNPGCVHGQG